MSTDWVYSDGGRKAAGYKGDTRDCAVRAIAIATGRDYKAIYKMVYAIAGKSPRLGVHRKHMRTAMEALGWEWVACMGIGTGCRVHVRADELPEGRLILSLSRHYAAFIDGVLHDTYNCSRDGTRCVYGYWIQK